MKQEESGFLHRENDQNHPNENDFIKQPDLKSFNHWNLRSFLVFPGHLEGVYMEASQPSQKANALFITNSNPKQKEAVADVKMSYPLAKANSHVEWG